MRRTELRTPYPRAAPLACCEVEYKVQGYRYLDVPRINDGPLLWDVIESRRSRIPHGPLEGGDLSTFLWMCAKIRSQRRAAGGCTVSHRPAPSAGGLHPIDMLLIENPARPSLAVYDAHSHALCDLRIIDEQSLMSLVADSNAATQNTAGTIVLFAANFDRTLARYKNGESLVWRDSGALLAICYLAAEALGVHCCGLGISGEPWLSRLIQSHSGVGGVGGCVVGTGADESKRLAT